MNYDFEQINSLIRNRRSIFPKMYTGDPVPKHIIEQMLENANWAPTHKFTEPWRFTVFYQEAVKEFAEFQSSLYQDRSNQNDTFDKAKYHKLKEKPLMAACIIAIGMKRDPELPDCCRLRGGMLLVYRRANFLEGSQTIFQLKRGGQTDGISVFGYADCGQP
jgi:hypothetical protein